MGRDDSGRAGAMGELTLEQQRAIALANARLRLKERSQPPQDAKPFGTRLWENIVGDDDPTTHNTGEKIGTTINRAIESATFGLIGDEFNAGVESLLPGVSYEDRLQYYRDQDKIIERDNPGLALGGDVGGATAGAVIPAGSILRGLGTLGRQVGLLPRLGASTATGTAMGATHGFMSGEGTQGRLETMKDGALMGGIFGAGAPVVGKIAQNVGDAVTRFPLVRSAVKGAPSADDLRALGRDAYKRIDAAGVQVRPDHVVDLKDALRAHLQQGGTHLTGATVTHPMSRAIQDSLDEFASGKNTVPWQELDMFRRFMGAGAAKSVQDDARLTTEAVSILDDFVNRLDANDVDAGDIETLQELLPKARELWTRMRRSQNIDDAIEAADYYVSGPVSGLRNRFGSLLKNKDTRRQFSLTEQRLMQRVAQGSFPERLLYNLAGTLGQIGSIGLGASAGAFSYGLPGLLAGGAAGTAVSAVLQQSAEALARRNAEIARAAVASGALKNVPEGSPAWRAIVEDLTRRLGAAPAQ